MNLLIGLIAAASLVEEGSSNLDSDIALNVQEVEASFAQDEESPTKIVNDLKVEMKSSIDESVDREMSLIIQSDPVGEETIEEVAPQLEDLSYLVKRPAVTIAEPESGSIENSYENLPISIAERQKISNILMTMAENNIFKLLFEKKRLEKLGREINHVHPMRFLGTVFSDPRLVHCMYEIRRSGFKWDGFIDGFSQRFLEELRAGNINVYVPGFAKSLNMKKEDILAYINFKDFEGLVLYLMEKSRQR